MLLATTKLAVHRQQLKSLWRHYEKLNTRQVVEQGRLYALEQQLLNHLYTLAATDEAHWINLSQIERLVNGSIEEVFELTQEIDSPPLLLLIKHLFGTRDFSGETDEVLAAIGRSPVLADLLVHNLSAWQLDFGDALRQRILSTDECWPTSLICMAFSSVSLSRHQLLAALEHSNPEIAFAVLVNMWIEGNDQLSQQLIKRFAMTDDVAIKAKLLQLAGLLDDPNWDEPSLLYCQQNPSYIAEVCPYFSHTRSLQNLVQLLQVPSTAKGAYEAWKQITNIELPEESAISDVKTGVKSQKSQKLPSFKQAEYERQALASANIHYQLAGRDELAPNQWLDQGVVGLAVQRKLAKLPSRSLGAALYFVQMHERQWQLVKKELMAC
ncbi:hypothetical protein [Pseudoalteromonas piscicida]|uniref:TIGR02270 family protein n=1 Tax=Pseudoalteromonas piscicida TaxID=43662 RepID=A0A2A5JKF4_PSEO7|nr:hypothetical protein [Pseudoalteromonas piscicida]PCK29711.1 hypothetical protein CEX98_21305 [Pseudoalteromonas piscicida]